MSGKVEDMADKELGIAEKEAGLKAAKDFVNEIRVKCGMRRIGRLRKGYRSNPLLCPMAIALECCGVFQVYDRNGEICLLSRDGRVRSYKRPEVVRWMRDYDQGKYPELVIPPTPIKMRRSGERKATVIG